MNRTPVNKQAAIFLSRKPRVETIEEAFRIFTDKIRDEKVVASALDLLDGNEHDESPTLEIVLKLRKDQRSPGLYCSEMVTRLNSEMGRESFFGLG